MSYTLEDNMGAVRTTFQIGDVTWIPHYINGLLQYTKNGVDKKTGEPLYMPDSVPYQFKMPQRLQNRNKYLPNGELK